MAFLEVLHHLETALVAEVEGSLSEVSLEEVSERGNSSLSLVADFVSRGKTRHGRLEVDRGPEGKPFDFGVEQLASAEGESSLEGVAGYVSGVRVVGHPLVCPKPRSGLHQSLSDFLRLVSASIEFSSH